MNQLSLDSLKVSTRFGSNPMHQNTFINFQPMETSGMFMGNEDRYDVKPNHRIKFQKLEKSHQSSISLNRVNKLRGINETIHRKA